MTIKISDIVDIIESYRNKNAYTHEQMSKLFGMSSRSTYNQFVNKKQNITIQKFLNFLNNTGTSFESFMLKFYKLNDQKNILEAEDFTSPYNVKNTEDTNVRLWKRIEDLEALNNELCRALINIREKGCIEKGESSGGVEKNRDTG